MKRINLIFLVLSLSWMSTIFCFSAQDGTESKQSSLSIGYMITNVFFSDLDEQQAQELAERIDHPVRKCAHAFEYTVLGILLFFSYKNRNLKWILIAWLICILYASSDEFHQLFVPGRSGQISDVCLDSAGALLGIGISYLLLKQKKRV